MLTCVEHEISFITSVSKLFATIWYSLENFMGGGGGGGGVK